MNELAKILFCLAMVLFIGNQEFAQEKKVITREPAFVRQDLPKVIPVIKEAGQFGSSFEEMEYYAPIRYVIVYNDIFSKFDIVERRMDVLLDEKSFNKENLTAVFTQIAKKFPDPLSLRIQIHTNLATIETPEERKMDRDGEDSRFREKKYNYKDAYYMRGIGNKDGSATFFYDLSLHPETFGRVDLVATPKK